jgi:uncharacterized protein YjbJ (UPF0337 family)
MAGQLGMCLDVDRFPTSFFLTYALGVTRMKPSTEDEIAGRIHEVKGTIKEKVGELTNDPDLEGEGIGEKIAGKVRKKIGQVEKALEK